MGTKYEIYVGKPMYEALQEAADSKNTTKSAFMNEILTSVGLGNNEFKPIILQVPRTFLDNRAGKEKLQEWLDLKVSGIVNHYFPQ